MSKFNLLNFNFTSIILIFLSFLSISFEVSIINNLYFIIIFIFSFFQNSSNYKFKNFFSGIIAVLSFYIQFILNDYTFSKEYFIHLLLILAILKYSELEVRDNYYFFTFTCIFLGISSLLYGQDLISSVLSFLIVLISIIQLYSLNQTKIINLNIKYLIRYLLFSLSIFPIIAIIYLVFPRTEINIKLFETQQNNLGIPDKIRLGSFENISNDDEEVFIFIPKNKKNKNKFYFRVKTFNILDSEYSWVSANYDGLLNQFIKNIKYSENANKRNNFGRLILNSHEKNWIPKLSNYKFYNPKIEYNIFDNLAYSRFKISKKTAFELYPQNNQYLYDQKLQNFFTELPKNLSSKLKEWSKKNLDNSKNNKDYLDKILNEFASGNFYYDLSPPNIENNYEKFFFETKIGYCEYYAGTFAILSRLAMIPTRIVTGYYGGSLNSLGNFYIFKQQDAHSWVEVYLDNEWVRYDPTLAIPLSNIISSNNLNLNNENNSIQISNSNNFENKTSVNKIRLYFDYANYLWTNNFLKYDEKARDKLIEKKIKNLNVKEILKFFFFLISITYVIYFLSKILISRKIYFNIFFKKIKKLEKINDINLTHQELFNRISEDKKKELIDIFNLFEQKTFSKNNKISFKQFLEINWKIFRIKKTP